MNGDTIPDLASANIDATSLTVLLGEGSGYFLERIDLAAGGDPFGVAIADVSGDGHPDLLAVLPGSDVVGVFLNRGAGGFGTKTDLAAGARPASVAVGDVSGDGRLDLVTVDETGDWSRCGPVWVNSASAREPPIQRETRPDPSRSGT